MTLTEQDREALCKTLREMAEHDPKAIVDAATWLTQAAAMAARGPAANVELASIILHAAQVVYVVGRAGQDG